METVNSVGKAVDTCYTTHLQRLVGTNMPAEVVHQFQLACTFVLEQSGLGSSPSE